MPPDASPLDLATLCQQVGVTARTVRYYIQRGLLPSPGRRGPGTEYHQGHLDRLRLIRWFQQDHLPLAEIRDRLDALDDGQVAQALRKASDPAAAALWEAPDEALEYLRQVQRGNPAVSSAARLRAKGKAPREPFPRERAQWERLTLTRDIELHVRRPLTREQNRRLERLMEEARRILGQE